MRTCPEDDKDEQDRGVTDRVCQALGDFRYDVIRVKRLVNQLADLGLARHR